MIHFLNAAYIKMFYLFSHTDWCKLGAANLTKARTPDKEKGGVDAEGQDLITFYFEHVSKIKTIK